VRELLPPGRRRLAFILAAALAASGLAVLLIGQAAHFAELGRSLRHAAPGWLVVCALGELAAYAGYVAAYRAMAEFDGGPRLRTGLAVRVVILAFGAFSLATAVGGLSVDLWALSEAGEPPARAGARVIAFETLRWAMLSVATCVAGLAALTGLARPVPWPAAVAWLVIVPACFAGGLWVSAPVRRERLMHPRGGPLRRAFGVAVHALVYLRGLTRNRAGLRRRALGGTAIYWGGDLLCAWAALRAFGAHVGLAPLLVGYATGYVSEAVPLPAGGSGGVDAAMTGGFVLAGAPLSEALLAAVTFRVFTFWLPALVAVPSIAGAPRLRDRLREVAAERG
jgi:uncharacterized membrane protein YbhN (UPF0104 family)